jgi:diketogulonate reductase-like aldo/keto reductase
MEAAVTSGAVRNVGVANFGRSEIDELMATWLAPPVVNQIPVSPFEYRRSLINKSESAGLVVQAYSPPDTGRYRADPVVRRIANALGRTPAQILLRWGIQKGLAVIAQSTYESRIEENFEVFDFELDETTVQALDELDTTGHTDAALEQREKWWS